MPAWVVFLLLQTLYDVDDDCKANPFVFIITIPALAHILPAECLPYTVYFINILPYVRRIIFAETFWYGLVS